jgi:hypothetical protein
MTKEDFFNLRIGQVIYNEGFCKKIITLFASNNCTVGHIQFNGDKTYTWDYVCEQCSLEPPKQKKKYHQWIFESKDTCAYTDGVLYDDNGVDTIGNICSEWGRLKKKKIESISWEE